MLLSTFQFFAIMGSSAGNALCEMNKTVLELNISPNDILSSCVPDSSCLSVWLFIYSKIVLVSFSSAITHLFIDFKRSGCIPRCFYIMMSVSDSTLISKWLSSRTIAFPVN